jgi:hypothetical protein
MSIALQRARLPEARPLLTAFLIVFALGSVSGFAFRAVSTPIAQSTPRIEVVRVTEPCPVGSHAVVWYSARAWGCASDAGLGQ